jgi:nucleoside-diphosphate-sugar epimerase
MQGVDVLVIGGAGRTGRLLVQGALERGHEVTALAGAPEELGPSARRVRVVRGDVRDGGAVSDAVDGREAALVALADTADGRGGGIAAQGTLNVVRSMQRYGVRRLVVLSTGGVAPPGENGHPSLLARLIDPRSRGGYLADLRRMEVSVRQSRLDWTLVRAAKLVDGPGQGGYRAGPGYALPGGTGIARADVAAFMLDELERSSNVAHAVALAT